MRQLARHVRDCRLSLRPPQAPGAAATLAAGRSGAAAMTLRVLDFGCVSPIASQAIYHGIGGCARGRRRAGRHPVQSDRSLHLRRCACRTCGSRSTRPTVGPAACRCSGARSAAAPSISIATSSSTTSSSLGTGRRPRPSISFPGSSSRCCALTAASGSQPVYRPINDIHVDGRKIGGTAAALDRRGHRAGRQLPVRLRRRHHGALPEGSVGEVPRQAGDERSTSYITTMAKLLPAVPPRALVKQRYLAEVAEWLGDEVRAERSHSRRARGDRRPREEHGRSRVRLSVRPPQRRLGRQGRDGHPSHRGRVEGRGRPDPGGAARTRRRPSPISTSAATSPVCRRAA